MEIFISAGEASGDLYGSHLARAIRAMAPQVRLSCLGGAHLRAEGVQVVVDNRKISVVGLTEVLAHIKSIYSAWLKIRSHILANRPELIVLIDFPDFNFLLGSFAKKHGLKVMYYVSPQIWAWRVGRVRKIRKFVDRMAVILPFEKEFYASHGLDVDYFGHPLMDLMIDSPDREDCRGRYHPFSGPLVGLLPGSRHGEIKFHFDVLMEAGKIISKSLPEARFVLPVAPSLGAREVERMAAKWELPLQVVQNDTHGAIRASDLIVTASGTVTLEAAILETPMIIFYRVSKFTRMIGKIMIRANFAGLPNLITGKEIAPEFVREDPAAADLAECAIRLLSNRELLDEQRRELGKLRHRLGGPGVSARVARLVLETAAKAI